MAGGKKGIVAAGSVHTARAALIALEAGGNAFDAAVSAFFAACVAEPVLASPGGGGFLLAWRGGDPVLYDFFTQTPRQPSEGQLDFFRFTPISAPPRRNFISGSGPAPPQAP